MSSDNRNGHYVSEEELVNANAPVMVSVRKEGKQYHVKLRGEEIVVNESSFLVISRDNGKFIVETEGKRMVMDDAEFNAFHFGLADADREYKRLQRERRAKRKEVRNA